MGALVLPLTGSIYVDANCVIYSIERVEPYCALLEPLWVSSDPYHIVSSELTLLEVLVKPCKTGDTQLAALFRDLLLESSDVALLPITQAVLERAALLRAATTLRHLTLSTLLRRWSMAARCSSRMIPRFVVPLGYRSSY